MTTSRYLSNLGEAVAALHENRNFFYPLRHGTIKHRMSRMSCTSSNADSQSSSRMASAPQ